MSAHPMQEDGHGAAPFPLEWKFGQVFGERAAGEEVQDGKRNPIN